VYLSNILLLTGLPQIITAADFTATDLFLV